MRRTAIVVTSLAVMALGCGGVRLRPLLPATLPSAARLLGELETRRMRGRTAWAIELLVERYGSLGVERLGGRKRAEELARTGEGTALDAFSALATRAGLEPAPPKA